MISRLREQGFTLVESIVVMVALAIAAVAVISLNANIFSGQASNRNLLVATALMQGCAENILATRRISGYDATSLNPASPSCGGSEMTVPGFGAPTVTITAGNSGTAGMTACPYDTASDPDANDCKLVSITQGSMSPILLLLVKG